MIFESVRFLNESKDNIDEIVKKYDLESARNLPNHDDINKAEDILQIKFSNEFKNYLLRYGMLTGDGFEIYGLTHGYDIEKARLVRETISMHEFDQEFKSYIVIENDGFGNLYLVKENKVYFYNHENSKIVLYANNFSEYLEKRCIVNM